MLEAFIFKEVCRMNHDLTYWVIIVSFVMPVLLSVGLILFFVKYQKRQHMHKLAQRDALLREQALKLERHKALEQERNRIASEMHDDIGSGLTSIKFLSHKALRNSKDEKQKATIQKISDYAQGLVKNMSEIIWALNSGFDTLDNLIAFIRRYCMEYLAEYDIDLIFEVSGQTKGIEMSGEKRRGVFLIIKEAVHNIVKHSKANNCIIRVSAYEELSIVIIDNGKGFNQQNIGRGYGMTTMKNRAGVLGGKVDVLPQDIGVQVKITLPLQSTLGNVL